MSDYATQRDARVDATLTAIDSVTAGCMVCGALIPVDGPTDLFCSPECVKTSMEYGSDGTSDEYPCVYDEEWDGATTAAQTAKREHRRQASSSQPVVFLSTPTLPDLNAHAERMLQRIRIDRTRDDAAFARLPRRTATSYQWRRSEPMSIRFRESWPWPEEPPAPVLTDQQRNRIQAAQRLIQSAITENVTRWQHRLMLEMLCGSDQLLQLTIAYADSHDITYQQMAEMIYRGEWPPPAEPTPAPTPQEIRARALELRQNRNTGPVPRRRRPPRNIEPRGTRCGDAGDSHE